MRESEPELAAELLVDRAIPGMAALSPDGARIAYLVSEAAADGERHTGLWTVRTDGATPPTLLTLLAGRLVRTGGLRWSADGRSVFCLSDGRLLRIRLEQPGSGAAVAAPEPIATHEGGIVALVPFADGRRLALITGGEPDAGRLRRAGEGDDAYVWGTQVPGNRLWIFDLADASWTPVAAFDRRHVTAVAVRPDDAAIAVVSRECALEDPGVFTGRLNVVSLADTAPFATAVAPALAPAPAPVPALDLGPVGVDAMAPAWWRVAGRWHVAYIAAPLGRPVGYGIFDVDVPTGLYADERSSFPRRHHDLTPGTAACPLELVQTDGSHLLALFAEGLDSLVYRLDGNLSLRCLIARTGHLESLTVNARGDTIAALASSGTQPVEVHAGPANGPLRPLTRMQHAFDRIVWGTQQRVVHRAADGLEIEGVLVLPPHTTSAAGPFPLITLIHGGPYARHVDAAAFQEQPCPQWLAAAGYAVFLPNPRGSLGRGRAFAQTVLGAVGTVEWTDILSGVDALIADGTADPDRLAVMGWGHGGYLAAWAITQTRRFRAAIIGAGISSWPLQVAGGDLGTRDGILAGASGWDENELSARPPSPPNSPITHACRIRTPALLLHGEDDADVPLSQSLYLHRALRHYGVDHELVVYPREGHDIRERAHQLDVMRRCVAWLDRRLPVRNFTEQARSRERDNA
ncbi:hypothetical protein GCM10009839_68450 [Catenulispora yoronensis]|uniref:Peptidase S9 prolyl oligopeptidase catalytic domain-containing protein n=1 Tax=Catenulispora yoronensis TaxID=450799 RepID=A0ABP5GMU0_9ACTN